MLQAHQRMVEYANRFGSLARCACTARRLVPAVLPCARQPPARRPPPCQLATAQRLPPVGFCPASNRKLLAAPACSFKLLHDSVLISDPAELDGLLGRRGADELPKPAFIYSPLDPVRGVMRKQVTKRIKL